jgi:hypothetical protein
MRPDNIATTLATYIEEVSHGIYGSLLRDLDETIRLLEQAAMSGSRATALQKVADAQRLLEEIERYLTKLALNSVQQEALRERRAALIARVQPPAL